MKHRGKHLWQRVKHPGSFRKWERENKKESRRVEIRFKWELLTQVKN